MHAIDYPFRKEIEVIFHDLNALGHVNNVTYFIYLETARVSFFRQLFPYRQTEINTIVGSAEIRYLAPAHLGDTLTVGTGISRWGNKSFDFSYHIDNQAGRTVATAKTTLIAVLATTGQSIPIPLELRQVVEAFQAGWVWSEK